MTVALLTEGEVPTEYIEAYRLYSALKRGLLRPFPLSELDALPASLVGRLLTIDELIDKVAEVRGTPKAQEG